MMWGRSIRTGIAAGLAVVWSLSVPAAEAPDPDPFAHAIEHAHYVGALALAGEVYHVQGLVLDGPNLWVTSVDDGTGRGWLHEFDRATGRFLRRLELTDGPRDHPGGMSLTGRSLWVPVAEPRPHSTAVLLEIDADTLHIRRRIPVADHLGCVAASPRALVAGNWDSRLLYVFDPATGAPIRVVPNPSPNRYQDMKFVGDELVAGGVLTLWSGAVDWLDWPGLRLRQSVQAGMMGAFKPFGRGGPFTGEGMAIEGRDLWLLPEDGPSRVFHFRLDTVPDGGAPARAVGRSA